MKLDRETYRRMTGGLKSYNDFGLKKSAEQIRRFLKKAQDSSSGSSVSSGSSGQSGSTPPASGDSTSRNLTNALIGALVGGGAGYLTDYLRPSEDIDKKDKIKRSLLSALVGAGVGGAAGYSIAPLKDAAIAIATAGKPAPDHDPWAASKYTGAIGGGWIGLREGGRLASKLRMAVRRAAADSLMSDTHGGTNIYRRLAASTTGADRVALAQALREAADRAPRTVWHDFRNNLRWPIHRPASGLSFIDSPLSWFRSPWTRSALSGEEAIMNVLSSVDAEGNPTEAARRLAAAMGYRGQGGRTGGRNVEDLIRALSRPGRTHFYANSTDRLREVADALDRPYVGPRAGGKTWLKMAPWAAAALGPVIDFGRGALLDESISKNSEE